MPLTPRSLWAALKAALRAFRAGLVAGKHAFVASFSGYSVSSGSVNALPDSYAVAHSEAVVPDAPCLVERADSRGYWHPVYQGFSGAEAQRRFLKIARNEPDAVVRMVIDGVLRDWRPR